MGKTKGHCRLVVVGQGYVGLPLAMRAVEVGHTVVGFDTDPDKVKRLVAGQSYVDDVPSDVLKRALAGGTPQSREAIMQAIALVRDERAAPLFAYILGQ